MKILFSVFLMLSAGAANANEFFSTSLTTGATVTGATCTGTNCNVATVENGTVAFTGAVHSFSFDDDAADLDSPETRSCQDIATTPCGEGVNPSSNRQGWGNGVAGPERGNSILAQYNAWCSAHSVTAFNCSATDLSNPCYHSNSNCAVLGNKSAGCTTGPRCDK